MTFATTDNKSVKKMLNSVYTKMFGGCSGESMINKKA